MNPIGSIFGAIDAFFSGISGAIRGGVRSLWDGPLQGVLVALIIGVVGLQILCERFFRRVDDGLAIVEKAFVFVAMLAMTFLAFNDFLAREYKASLEQVAQSGSWVANTVMAILFGLTLLASLIALWVAIKGVMKRDLASVGGGLIGLVSSTGVLYWLSGGISGVAESLLKPETGIWSLEGQANIAMLLMVVVGFVGASIATREGKHLTIDAADRVLSPGSARFVKRFTSLVASILCLVLAKGSWTLVFESSQDAFEGAKVWAWFVTPINWLTQHFVDWQNYRIESAFVAPETGDAAKALALEKLYLFGPGTEFGSNLAWEDAMYDLGAEFDAMPHAFYLVESGDRFPLWLPLMLLVVAFGVMAMRFFGHAVSPPTSEWIAERPNTNRRVSDVVIAGIFPGAIIALGLGAYFGQGLVIMLASILLVLMGAPLFAAVGVGTVASWVLLRDAAPDIVVSDMFEATKKQELLAIPFFVLAGNLMTRGSIAQRLIRLAQSLLGPLPGGLGVAGVLSCAIFAAISGSSPVTVIAIGSIMFPMLIEEGYDENYSMGLLTSAGGLGIIIPPSVPMIVYAIMVSGIPSIGSKVTPDRLFLAGVGPGLLIILVLTAWTFFVSWPRSGVAGFGGMETYNKSNVEPMTGNMAYQAVGVASYLLIPTLLVFKTHWILAVLFGPIVVAPLFMSGNIPNYLERLGRSALRGLLSIMLPVLILGGIYGWFDVSLFGYSFKLVFSVTEAAAVAVVYSLFVELVVNRELKWRELPSVVSESAVMMGSLFLILVIAISLNRFFVFQQVPEMATEFMLANVETKLGFLIVVNIFLLLLGCVMDILSAILIVAPLLAPIAASYGINPVHFGIMFIVNLELGYLTPPMGINLFVASTVFERSILDVIRAVLPFLFLMLFCLVLIIWFPSLSLFLLGE